MQVILSAGPMGGEIVEWAGSGVDGEVLTLVRDGAEIDYRLDYVHGHATHIGGRPAPPVGNPFALRADEVRKSALRDARAAEIRAIGGTPPVEDLAGIPDGVWAILVQKAKDAFNTREAARAVL